MTNFDGTGPTLDPGSAEQSRIDPNQGSVGGDAAFDPNHLASILAFIGHEIDHSLAMLRDLAALLSAELCALGQADSVKAVQQGLICIDNRSSKRRPNSTETKRSPQRAHDFGRRASEHRFAERRRSRLGDLPSASPRGNESSFYLCPWSDRGTSRAKKYDSGPVHRRRRPFLDCVHDDVRNDLAGVNRKESLDA